MQKIPVFWGNIHFLRIIMMLKSISLSITVLSTVIFSNLSLKTTLASHTDDGFHICNRTKVTHSFTLLDVDYDKRKNFSLKPNECWEYWEYETIIFVDNFGTNRRYKLNENYDYYFQFESDGRVDFFKTSH